MPAAGEITRWRHACVSQQPWSMSRACAGCTWGNCYCRKQVQNGPLNDLEAKGLLVWGADRQRVEPIHQFNADSLVSHRGLNEVQDLEGRAERRHSNLNIPGVINHKRYLPPVSSVLSESSDSRRLQPRRGWCSAWWRDRKGLSEAEEAECCVSIPVPSLQR